MSLAPSAPPLLQPTLASLGVDDVPEGSVAFKPVYGYTNEQVTHTWHPAARSTHACATLQAGGGVLQCNHASMGTLLPETLKLLLPGGHLKWGFPYQ